MQGSCFICSDFSNLNVSTSRLESQPLNSVSFKHFVEYNTEIRYGRLRIVHIVIHILLG